MKGSNPSKQKMGEDYLASALLHENSDLRKKINGLEEENMKLAHMVNDNNMGAAKYIMGVKKKIIVFLAITITRT